MELILSIMYDKVHIGTHRLRVRPGQEEIDIAIICGKENL